MVFAHTGGELGGILDGLLHPITGYDHLVVMVAVGVATVFAYRNDRRRALAVPAAFAGALLAGAALGVAGLGGDWVETAILATVVCTPLLVAAGGGQVVALAGFAGLAGAFHGMAHGLEAPVSAESGFLVGMVVATLALHAVGFFVAARIASHRHGRSVLVAGTALAGIAVLAAGGPVSRERSVRCRRGPRLRCRRRGPGRHPLRRRAWSR
ncbi:MAG: HupE/UreJ family protein [Acidimicrobiales bacterium]